MPRIFWTPARDETLRENYPVLGPNPTASLLGVSRRSVINRAHRLSLKAPYPQNRARPSFPPQSWSSAEKRLAQALLDFFRIGSPLTDDGEADSWSSVPLPGNPPNST